MSIKILTLDLAEPPADVTGCEAYTALLALVRIRGHALGWVQVEHQGRAQVSGAWLRAAVADKVNWELLPHALLPGYSAAPAPTPPISVIVLSDGDPAALTECLRAITAGAYPLYECIVVDHAPSAASERIAAQFPAVRFVQAAGAGAGAAWNLGAAAARYELLAFLGVNCRPDPHWLHALAAGFAVAAVGAVSGPIAPLALDTPAQRCFEAVCGGLGRDTYSRTVHPATASLEERVGALGLGSGNNLALRRDVLLNLGGFNPALDAGADQELLVRLLADGMSVRYSGDALVRHAHPADWRALGRTLFERGRGQGAALLATVRTGSIGRGAFLRYAVFIWFRAILGRVWRPNGLPRRLALLELFGAVRGLIGTRNHP
jgi:cellulose synthase/poly-beta-1,6-N-acetylglucosamine synthase-like glycosyltransferase